MRRKARKMGSVFNLIVCPLSMFQLADLFLGPGGAL
jgi:hypothetical protein